MLVDASALVAIVLGEPEGPALAQEIERSDIPVTTPIAVFEAVLGIRRVLEVSVGNALHALTMFLQRAGIAVVPLDADAYLVALAAFERFGKGSGHPAQLNMGDCFAYAAARQHSIKLLYKGDDFAHTDLA